MLRKSLIIAFAITAALAAWPGQARAQLFGDRILTPAGGITSATHAHALALNPAGMTLNSGWELDYFHSEVAGGQGLLPGTGDAVYASAHVLGPLHLGIGFEFVRPARAFLEGHFDAGYSGTGWSMGVFAIGFNVGKMLSVATSLRAWISPSDYRRMNGLVAWDMALHLHPSQYVSFMAAAYDINAPGSRGIQPVERTWGLGVAIRPLGRDFFTFTADNFIGERSRNDTLRLSLEVEPVRGIGIVASGTLLFGDEYPLGSDRKDKLHDVQISLALRLDLSHLGLWTGYHLSTMNRSDGFDGTMLLGWSVGLRISGQRHKSVMSPKRYVPVKLNGALGPSAVVGAILRLEYLRRDPKVAGVIIQPKNFGAPPGAVQDLREAIGKLREAGKRVICHADEATSSGYYLCTAADRIYLGPPGGVRLSGYRTKLVFFTGLLEKLGINAQIVRIGEYKSHPEKYTLKSPSQPSLEQYRALLEDVWAEVVADVAAGRGVEPEQMEKILEKGPFNAKEAVDAGLADALAYEDELCTMIQEDTGRKILIDKKYWKVPHKPSMWNSGSKKVAVLTVGGAIVEGRSRTIPLLGMQIAGDETLVKALKRARIDPTIAAVVLRVESGGGSSIASDRIWRAAQKLAETKPVVASIGGVAASGGYYVLAPAAEVIANPTSVTGSIGIFYGKADLSGLLSKVGIDVTVLKQGGERTDMESWHRPYSPEEIAFLEKELNHFYNLFLSRVSAGRDMTKEEVDKVGQGRVWSGTRAKDKGLVDRMGGLTTAIDRARTLGGVPDWVPVVDITPGPSLLEKIVGTFTGIKHKGSGSDLAAMIARAAGLDALYPMALFLMREDESPIALCPLTLEL